MKYLSIPFLALTLASGLATVSASAEEIRYISDKQYVPLRSGQGTQYRIVHRGLPSGTALVIGEVNEETGYTQVTTPGGTEGWIRSQYLMQEEPARQQLDKLLEREKTLSQDSDSLRQRYIELEENYQQVSEQLNDTQSELQERSTELAEVQRVSANALALDDSNRRLAREAEVMKSRLEILEADNQRLQENKESDAFFNGALAVLLGVIITLLVPRLWPQRRRSSSWA